MAGVPKRNVHRLGMSCDIWECPSLIDCFYILIFLVYIYLTGGVHSMVPGVLTCYFMWSSALYLATLCRSYSVGMLPEVVYDTALDMLVFGLFFGVLILLSFARCSRMLGSDAERCQIFKNYVYVHFILFELWHS